MTQISIGLPRQIALIAWTLIAILGIGVPLLYYATARQALVVELQTKAEFKAEAINRIIGTAPEMWKFQEHRLRELLNRQAVDHLEESSQITDNDGTVIATSQSVVQIPYLERFVDLSDSGTKVGQIALRRSLTPLFFQIAIAALVGFFLAVVMYFVIRRIPRQAAQMVDAIFVEKERAQVTLSSIGDGVITTDQNQIIDFLNPVAEAITGWSLVEAKGRKLDEVMQLYEEGTNAPTPTPMSVALSENRVASFTTEVVLRMRDGTTCAIEDSAAPIKDRLGEVIGGVMVFHDVTIARGMAQRISWAATHDVLTGLVNRREFESRVEAALSSARNSAAQHALMFLDLDQFKVVNDTCGHAAGDTLLKEVAIRLQDKLRQSDTLARLGGDEFGVLLDGCPLVQAELIAADLLAGISEYRLVFEGKTFGVGVSIGLVCITGLAQSTEWLFAAADTACYAAKEQGRNRVRVYHGSDEDMVQRRKEMGWATRLTQALEQGRFTLFYQNYMALGKEGNGALHLEILLRMIDEDGELIMPGSFIAAAERYNVMPAIDRWVIKTVFSRYHDLAAEFGATLTCAINLSGTTLNSEGLFKFIKGQAATHALPKGAICFEITETAAINNLRLAAQFMRDIKELGFMFALDDFGTGTSSFGYLRNLPVDYLKIDGSFVRDIATDPLDKAMAETINRVGHIMGLKTVGEFAESDTVIGELRGLGVDFAQGYAVHKPQQLPSPRALTTVDRS